MTFGLIIGETILPHSPSKRGGGGREFLEDVDILTFDLVLLHRIIHVYMIK